MKDYRLNGNVFVDADSSEIFGSSDGDETENYIFDSIQNATDLSTGSEELKQFIKDWPSLYYLHPKRVNLLRPLEDQLKGKNILEIGSSCGVITRYLGETASSVTALEVNFRRAQITAERCRDLSNVKVICDNFQDFSTSEQFDVITLIGVLQYATLYIKEDDPVKTMLSNIRAFLKPGGIVLIAIENKLGLKYWAGAPEDHTGQAYQGIENRYSSSTAVTFGKKELEKMLRISGFAETTFLYPFPDYKMADSIVTEKGLRTKEFSVPMLLLEGLEYIQSEYYSNHFSTSLAAAELEKNGLLADFSNSFLVAASSVTLHDIISPDILAARYNTQRKKEYQKVNIFRDRNGQIGVEKTRLYPDSLVPDRPVRNVQADEPYFQGRLLLFDAIKIVSQKHWLLKSLSKWAGSYFSILKNLSFEQDGQLVLEGKYLDLTPFNILLGDQNEVRIFDQEWIYPGNLPLGYIFFRGINYSLGAISFFNIPAEGVPEDILGLTTALSRLFLPLPDDEIALYRELEIKNLSGVGTSGYIPFMPAPMKVRKEALMERQVLLLEREKIQTEARVEQLNTSLAHGNHENFLKEAELGVLRQMAARQQPSFPEMNTLAEAVTRLSDMVANIHIRQPLPSRPSAPEEDLLKSLNKQIKDLQDDVLWFKRTYEDRSLLGVIRQKIALKFSK